MASRASERRELPRERIEAGVMAQVGEAKPRRAIPRHPTEVLVVALREMNELSIVLEIRRPELTMTIEPERAIDQAIEMAHQEVGRVETSGLGFAERAEDLAASQELVAMRPRHTL